MKTVRSKDGTEIAYDVFGNGPALIFISGATCFRNFMPVKSDAKGLGKAFTVYNYDRRGRGDSKDAASYSVEKEVDDIEALIDAAGGKAFLYGHSSGAVLALETALRCLGKVEKFVIFDAAYVENDKEKLTYGELILKVKAFIAQGENVKALRAFLIGIGMPKFFIYLLPLMPGWKTMKALAPTLLYDMELTRDVAPTERLSKIKASAMIYYGEKSPASMKSVAEQIGKSMKNAIVQEVKRVDHMVTSKTLLPLFSAFFGVPK